jgi:hypothetical protein
VEEGLVECDEVGNDEEWERETSSEGDGWSVITRQQQESQQERQSYAFLAAS